MLEDQDVAEALLDYISRNGIEFIVLGATATSRIGFSRYTYKHIYTRFLLSGRPEFLIVWTPLFLSVFLSAFLPVFCTHMLQRAAVGLENKL